MKPFLLSNFLLFNDLSDDTSADGETAFTDGELGTLLESHRHDEFDGQVDKSEAKRS